MLQLLEAASDEVFGEILGDGGRDTAQGIDQDVGHLGAVVTGSLDSGEGEVAEELEHVVEEVGGFGADGVGGLF